MNKLSPQQRAQIISALVEGNSLRAAARITGAAFNTVLKLLPEIGLACEEYQRRVFRNLQCKRVQCDEIWSFCYAKEKNVPADKQGKFGFGSGSEFMLAAFLAAPNQLLRTSVLPESPIRRAGHDTLDRLIGQGNLPRIAANEENAHGRPADFFLRR
jgi:hypothetical protein